MAKPLDLEPVHRRSDRYLAKPTATLAMASASDVPGLLGEVERGEALRAELGAEVDRLSAELTRLRRNYEDLADAKADLESLLRKAQREQVSA